MTIIRKRLGKLATLALAGGLATAAFTGTAHANEILQTGNYWASGSYNDGGRTGNFQFQAGVWDGYYGRYQQAIVWVSGADGGNARAECFRGNGGTNWYESTIVARNGTNSSHYDCSGNGTYNQGLASEGVDLHP